MQNPTVLLTILSVMARKPKTQFDKLFPKLYNVDLWLMAYQRLAPNPGNMTAGVDGATIDGTGSIRIENSLQISKHRATRQPRPARLYPESQRHAATSGNSQFWTSCCKPSSSSCLKPSTNRPFQKMHTASDPTEAAILRWNRSKP